MAVLVTIDGRAIQVDDDLYPALSAFRWYGRSDGYVTRHAKDENGKRRTVYLHRQIAEAPKGREVDHANGDRTDCRRSNLRLCTRSENARNVVRKRDFDTPPGVHFNSGVHRWVATVTHNGQVMYRRSFKTRAEAIAARREASLRFHGEFAPEMRKPA